jgi:ATP-binding cassette, subfamily B (MDR/TAP), member 1
MMTGAMASGNAQ